MERKGEEGRKGVEEERGRERKTASSWAFGDGRSWPFGRRWFYAKVQTPRGFSASADLVYCVCRLLLGHLSCYRSLVRRRCVKIHWRMQLSKRSVDPSVTACYNDPEPRH